MLDHLPLAGNEPLFSVTSSPSLRNRLSPQQGQAAGNRRARRKCSGSSRRAGWRRSNEGTVTLSAAAICAVSACAVFSFEIGELQLELIQQ
jgi:hypothetical protein